MMNSKMASGTESEVEDVESLECVADGSTGVSISKEKAGTDTESKPKEVRYGFILKRWIR